MHGPYDHLGFTCPSGNRVAALHVQVAIVFRCSPYVLRSTERASDVAIERAIERSTERSSDRAIDRAMDRSSDRSSDRAIDRVIAHRPIKRSSDESNRRVTKQTPISRAPGGHLTRRLVHSEFFVNNKPGKLSMTLPRLNDF